MTKSPFDKLGATLAERRAAADQARVLAFLGDPATYGLREPVTRIDTHGAVVFLAGENVLKVKRAVRYPYMDFSTLEKRRVACEAEIAINRANAPAIYIGVVPIVENDGHMSMSGEGRILEWAVRMKRFDENATLDRVAEKKPLGAELVSQLAAAIHASLARAPVRDGRRATSNLRIQLGETAHELLSSRLLKGDSAELGLRLAQAFDRIEELLLERGAEGRIRRCHGDLHLGNIVLIGGTPILFDAIEFDEDLATTDVLYEIAFPVMDLWERDRRSDARLLFNECILGSDEPLIDLEGLAAFPLFLSLRACVRCKVSLTLAAMRSDDRAGPPRALRYYDAAQALFAPALPQLIAIGGRSGTGKSLLAAQIADKIGRPPGALHLNSDVERKRLAGVAIEFRLRAASYTKEQADRVYDHLHLCAGLALKAGFSVLLDATYSQAERRIRAERIARDAGAPFTGIWLDAPFAVLADRVASRVGGPSDASVEVVRSQSQVDLGEVSWTRLEASVQPQEVFAEALATIIRPAR